MTNQHWHLFKNPTILMAAIAALSSTMTMTSTANAITLNLSVENLSPENGAVLSPVWFGLHDGTFNTFDPGSPASSAIEAIAEDGLTGLEFSTPGFSFDNTPLEGLNLNNTPIPLSSTIANLFTQSSGTTNDVIQGKIFENALGLFPGDAATVKINLDDNLIANNRFFSYVSMLIPTNDGFIGDDEPIEIFDAEGNFIGADFIVLGSDVWDAGTEVNDESLSSLPFSLEVLAQGEDENGVVEKFPGFTGDEIFSFIPSLSNADFTVEDYQVARIRVTQVTESVPEPTTTIGLFALGGLFVLRRRISRTQ
ncbi:MAG: PEP-CTERM sorting domain-containing protein [Symploca sp. SIO2B6]|nr:PEP-CTERM sorting domain-containing protein [Symploca sp. SIO2B6]